MERRAVACGGLQSALAFQSRAVWSYVRLILTSFAVSTSLTTCIRTISTIDLTEAVVMATVVCFGLSDLSIGQSLFDWQGKYAGPDF